MKKFIILALAIVFSSGLFAQNVIYTIPTAASKFNKPIKIGDFVYITADSTLYCSKVAAGPNATGTWLLALRSRYAIASHYIVSGAVNASSGLFSTTLGVTGAATFGSTLGVTGASTLHGLSATTGAFSGAITGATTLTMTGLSTLPWIHTLHSLATLDSSSYVVTGDCKAATVEASSVITTPAATITALTGGTGTFSSTLGVTGATTVTGGLVGTSITRGSGAFTTTSTRCAVAITGATSTDYYIVRGIASDQYTRPVAGDLLNCFAKTDSLIVMRAAGTTSGQGFTYFRIK